MPCSLQAAGVLRGGEGNTTAVRWTDILEQLHLIGLCRRLPGDFHCSYPSNRSNCALNAERRMGGEEGE